VTDMDAAFAARVKCRQEVFSGKPVLASIIVQIQRLAFPELMGRNQMYMQSLNPLR
jgi:hypothetical protein